MMTMPDSVRRTIEFALHFLMESSRERIIQVDWEESAIAPRAIDAALAWLSQQPAAPPVPDWSQAPSWANYWAVDRTGSSFWHEREPVRLAGQGWLSDGRRTLDSFPAEDWATTLQQRPQGQE